MVWAPSSSLSSMSLVCRILFLELRQKALLETWAKLMPVLNHSIEKITCAPLPDSSRRTGIPSRAGEMEVLLGLALVAHLAAEIGEIVLCLNLFCISRCHSVHLSRWGLLILKQRNDWYYMDLIISLNLQLRLGVDLKDWNVKEIIFWCELICRWGNWKVLVLFRKTKEWFHLCGVRRILGQIFKDQTLYPKHVRTDDFLRSLDDLSVISNSSTTLGFSGIILSRGEWVSLILKFMKMKTTPKILLYSDVEYNPWLLFLSK